MMSPHSKFLEAEADDDPMHTRECSVAKVSVFVMFRVNKLLLLQEDNGLPVHIKGGTTDLLLYRATMMLTIAGNFLMSQIN